MKKDERKCLECEKRLLGRIDKRFCDDSCRNSYNNAKNRVKHALVKRINTQLQRNYRILSKYNTKDKTTVARQTLSLEGFNFDLFTSIYTTKSNTTYYFVYDHGYLSIHNGDRYLLVKNKTDQ